MVQVVLTGNRHLDDRGAAVRRAGLPLVALADSMQTLA
jgi:hypothetical protein